MYICICIYIYVFTTVCMTCVIWFFLKIFLHFYHQVKQKAGSRFHSPTKNKKLMESLQTKQT